jgi:archaellum component FlaC
VNDIAQKLDNWAKYSTAGQKSVLIEARDEIERLREALKKIANGYSDEDGMKNIARAALKGDE